MGTEIINEKIKLVVVENHTLGYILPEIPSGVCILHTSILKGSPYSDSSHILVENHNVILATEKDFENFRCVFGSFGNGDTYEYNDTDQVIYIHKK